MTTPSRFLACLGLFTFAASLGSSAAAVEAKLGPEQRRILDEAKIDAFVRTFNGEIKSGADVNRVFRYRKNPKYQAELAQVAANVGELPKLERDGRNLVLHYRAGDLHVELRNMRGGQVAIEGMPWVFDPSAPPKLQIELLEARLKAQAARTESSALMRMMLPEANAIWAAIGKAGAGLLTKLCKGNCTSIGIVVTGWSIVAGNFSENLEAYTCLAFYSFDIQTPFNAGRCVDWREAYEGREKKKRERGITTWGLLKGKIDWTYDGTPSCAEKDGKGNDIYTFKVGEQIPGQEKEKTLTSFFKGKSNTNGMLKDAAIYASEEDANAPDASQRALAQFIYTEDTNQTAAGLPPVLSFIRVKNPDTKNVSANVSEFTMVDLAKPPSAVPTPVADQVFKLYSQIIDAQEWMSTCKILAKNAKRNPKVTEKAVQKMMTTPVPAKPEDTTTGAER